MPSLYAPAFKIPHQLSLCLKATQDQKNCLDYFHQLKIKIIFEESTSLNISYKQNQSDKN